MRAPWSTADEMWQADTLVYCGRLFLRSEPPLMSAKSRRWLRRLLRFLFRFTLVFMLVSSVLVLALRFVDPPFWAWKINRALLPPPGYPKQSQQTWVNLAGISTGMQLAVIAAEDQNFPNHYGFDFNAIARAFDHNERGRSVRGASTLTQQTAKNLFLWSSRSFVRKGIEAWFTLLIELMWSKQRILEVYLNVAEFGPGIYGVEAAARQYFRKPARALTWAESARLAAVLPNPYQYRVQPPSHYVAQRSQWIYRQMGQLGQVTLNKL